MHIHDWSRAEAGAFHGFHNRWLTHLSEALTTRVLPAGYYAEVDQHSLGVVPDVLTLYSPAPVGAARHRPTATTATATRPRFAVHATADRRPKAVQKTVVVRSEEGHRVVALMELVSAANKDRKAAVAKFAGKIQGAIESGIHATVLDLLPPTAAAPGGMHAALWKPFARTPPVLPADKPLALSAFVAKTTPEAYFEYLAVGDRLPRFPLFLSDAQFVPLPLAETYAATFAASPPYLRELLSAPAA